jgi:hypothetical protein
MQNREELKQKGHDGSKNTTCCERGKKYFFQKGGRINERGKKYHFQKGGRINIIFGPKYRPLLQQEGLGQSLKILNHSARIK